MISRRSIICFAGLGIAGHALSFLGLFGVQRPAKKFPHLTRFANRFSERTTARRLLEGGVSIPDGRTEKQLLWQKEAAARNLASRNGTHSPSTLYATLNAQDFHAGRTIVHRGITLSEIDVATLLVAADRAI